MKKSILLFAAVITSLQLFSQEKPSNELPIAVSLQSHTLACSIKGIEVLERGELQMNTIQDLIVALNANVPGFRGTTTGVCNEIPVFIYRNTPVNDIYVDGVRHDVSVLKNLNISDIACIQVFNSVMDSNLYSLTSK